MTQFGCFARGNHSSAWRTGRGGHTTLLQYPITGCSTVMVVYHTRWKYVGRGYRSTSLYYISHSTDAVAWYQLWWILTCRCKVSCALRSVHLHTLHNAKSGYQPQVSVYINLTLKTSFIFQISHLLNKPAAFLLEIEKCTFHWQSTLYKTFEI